MNKKRNWILMGIMILVVAALAGCGGEKEIKEDNNYVEQRMVLPKAADQAVDAVLLKDGSLGTIGFNKDETKGILWKSKDQGKTWDQGIVFTANLPVREMKKKDAAVQAVLSPTGEVFVMYQWATGNDKLLTECYFIKQNGKSKRLKRLEKESALSFPDFSEDGALYIQVEGGIKRAGADLGKPDVEYTAEQAQINAYTVFEDHLYLFDNEKVWGFALADGKPVTVDEDVKAAAARIDNSKNMEGGGQKIVLSRDASGNLTLDCMDRYGITRYTKSGALLLIDGKETCMYDGTGIVYTLVKQGQDHLLAAAYSESQNTLYQYAYKADKNKEKTAVTFYTLEENAALDKVLGTYQRNKPTVQVEVETGRTKDNGVTTSDALKTLNTDILSGNGPDVICLDGISAENFIDNGLLADLSQQVAEIDEKEGLFTNIIKDYKRGNKVYAVPTQFGFMGIVGDKKAVSSAGDFSEFLDEVESLWKEKSALSEDNFIAAIPLLYQNYLMPYVSKTDGLQGELLKDFYQQIHRLYELYDSKEILDDKEINLKNVTTQPYGYPTPAEAIRDKTAVQISSWNVLDDFRGLALLEKTNGMDHSLFKRGKHAVFLPKNIIGVSAKSSHKEIAKDLAAFFLTKKAQDNYYSVGFGSWMFSINEEVMREKLKEAEKKAEFYWTDSEKVTYPAMTKAQQQRTLKLLNSTSTAANTDNLFLEIVMDHLDSYLRGDLTLEQAVSDAMKKIKLYLAE